MAHPYDAWLERKLHQPPLDLRRSWSMSRTFELLTGGRKAFGDLTVSAEPSSAFSYIERITWPENEHLFTHSVLDGILDAVLIDLGHVPTGVSFTLRDIKWRDGQSVPSAYYRAARDLVSDIVRADAQSPWNED